MQKKKLAVVLANLGGPLVLADVKPFLFNLFRDPSILGLPFFLRLPLAWIISTARRKKAEAIYQLLGGGSPLLQNTKAQAKALEKELITLLPNYEVKNFIAMRYWHPLTPEAIGQVKEFLPDEIIVLPLYPQFSTTTTASSWRIWKKLAQKQGIKANSRLICCYPRLEGFIAAQVELVKSAIEEAKTHGKPMVLFSAHGLPEKIVEKGDPYPLQCQKTVNMLQEHLQLLGYNAGLDYDGLLCYQSRVGPLPWIPPYTESEIEKAAISKRPILVVPISFVSEHSETLVEIGMEYKHMAEEKGCPHFISVPTVATHPLFIKGLAEIVKNALHLPPAAIESNENKRLCPVSCKGCLNILKDQPCGT
ncbi:MAG: ferrochelatase [Alphaproteobacteria bacterium]